MVTTFLTHNSILSLSDMTYPPSAVIVFVLSLYEMLTVPPVVTGMGPRNCCAKITMEREREESGLLISQCGPSESAMH